MVKADRTPVVQAAPTTRSVAWDELRRWEQAVAVPRGTPAATDHLLEGRFRFLNAERHLPEIDFTAEYVSPLWTYHLHYFDYALDLACAWLSTEDERYGDRYVELWTSWLDAAEAGAASIEAYPVSVRCLNALRSLWLIEDRLPSGFADRLLGATHVQLEWLSRHLERDLRANHLQKNLAALAVGSIAFEGSAAADWRQYLEELWRELREQVLPDGCHFERSPMYHAAALTDFVRVVALCGAAGVDVPPDVPVRLRTMATALRYLSRPDGRLHLFSDSANGERPGPGTALALADRVLGTTPGPANGAFALNEGGYYGWIAPEAGRRLVVSAGPPGPAYQPGHAHCDMMSFEMDLAGRPIVVDSGLHGYDGDVYRDYVRSTRAHNTIGVDGRDQHEVWATFRIGRRGRILDARSGATTEGGFEFRGACRHYGSKGAVHHRRIEWESDRLTVTDTVEGPLGHPVTGWLHLHPDYRLERIGEVLIGSAGPDDPRISIDVFGADEVYVRRGQMSPVQGWYCPEFGRAVDAPVIEMHKSANDGRSLGYCIRTT